MTKITAIDAALDVAVRIGDSKPALYFNQVNTLTIALTNNTGTSCTFTPGAAVREDALKPDGPTSIYLWFGGALTSAEMLTLGFALPDGWTAQVFTDDDAPCIAIVPKQAVPPLLNGHALELTLTNVVVSGAVRTPTFTVDTLNVPGLQPGTWSTSLPIQNPPTGRELGLDPKAVGSGIVFVTQFAGNKIANRLTVALTNSGDAIPVQDGASPSIAIRFVYSTGDGYTALTTPDASTAIQLSAVRLGAQGREELHPQPIDVAPSKDQPGGRMWTLNPPGSQLLDAGGSFELYFDTIVTTLESGHTLLYLQFTGMGPAYNDHCYTVGIDKEIPDPGVVYFRCTSSHVIHAGDPVSLEWQTVGVAGIKLTYKEQTSEGTFDRTLTSAAGQIPLNAVGSSAFKLPAPPLVDTNYFLDTDPPSAKPPPPVAVEVITPPLVLSSIAVSPVAGNFDAGPVDITVSWSIAPKNLIKRLSLDIPGSDPVDVTGRDSYTIQGCTSGGPFTLTAFGLGGDQTYKSASAARLQQYLVGKSYSMSNFWQESHGETPTWWSITSDTLHFDSANTASYKANCDKGYGEYHGEPPDFSYPWGCNGQPWSLTGSVVSLATGLGALNFQFMSNGTLTFQNPPDIPGCPGYVKRYDTTTMKWDDE